MKKVLIVATVSSHIKAFHIPYIKWLKKNGYEVHCACYGSEKIEDCDKQYNIQFTRTPFSIKNIKAYTELKKIIKENKYEFIHCHTPVGGAISRLANKNLKHRSKIIYTAHGFHFYKGAKILNWMIYYPIEKYLSKFTDYIITMNKEDYNFAKRKFYKAKVVYVNGVGIDETKFKKKITKEEINKTKKELEIKKDDYIFLNIGELSRRKNQIMLINAILNLKRKYSKFVLLIAGSGKFKTLYEEIIAKYDLEENIKLLGYRKDINKLLEISDCVVATSKQEGLPVNVMEAMFTEKTIIATEIRGHKDLIKYEDLVSLKSIEELTDKMEEKYLNKENYKKYEIDKFKLENVLEEVTKIYTKIMDET